MFRRTPRLLLAAGLAVAASSTNATAQVVRTLTVSATVPDIGAVTSVSSLQWSEGQSDESMASGMVRTKHNGPYVLQVRLTTAHPDTVMARQPDGTFRALNTGEWTTVASGPGGANLSNTVDYRVRTPNGAAATETIPIQYRVIAP
jgi:hypothetical protein